MFSATHFFRPRHCARIGNIAVVLVDGMWRETSSDLSVVSRCWQCWWPVKRCGFGGLLVARRQSRLCATPVTSCTTQSGRTCWGSTSAFDRAWMRVCRPTVGTSRRKCVGSSLGGAECGAGCCASFVTTVFHEWVQNVVFGLVPVCVPSCGVWWAWQSNAWSRVSCLSRCAHVCSQARVP